MGHFLLLQVAPLSAEPRLFSEWQCPWFIGTVHGKVDSTVVAGVYSLRTLLFSASVIFRVSWESTDYATMHICIFQGSVFPGTVLYQINGDCFHPSQRQKDLFNPHGILGKNSRGLINHTLFIMVLK